MKRLFISLALVTTAAFSSAVAQDLKTAYFLDNYVYGYRLNPAAVIEGDSYFFLSLGIGNVTVGVDSNFPMSSLIAPAKSGSGVVFPFVNNEFTMDEALAGLLPDNRLNFGLNENLLAFGRQNENNRWSVELNLRSNIAANVPLDGFRFIKRGLTSLEEGNFEGTYNFSGLNFGTQTYSEVAFGYSQKIGDLVTVGARIKGLVGLAGANMDWDLSVKPGSVKDVSAETHASIQAALPFGLSDIPSYTQDGGKYYDAEELLRNIRGLGESGMDWKSLGPKSIAGWGLAGDFGVTLEPLDGLSISASVTDLGFISWNGAFIGEWDFKGEVDGDDYSTALAIKATEKDRYSSPLLYTIHAGTKYRMPFYDGLSVGLLGTFQKNYSEGRFGIDFTPFKLLSIAASAAYGTYGADFGAALNLRLPIFNLHVGVDNLLANPHPETHIPQKAVSTVINAGLSIVI